MQKGKFIHPNKSVFPNQSFGINSSENSLILFGISGSVHAGLFILSSYLLRAQAKITSAMMALERILFFPVLCGDERDPQLLVDKYLSNLET